jgi:hypothetical protein
MKQAWLNLVEGVDGFSRGALPHGVLAHGFCGNNAADPARGECKRAARLGDRGHAVVVACEGETNFVSIPDFHIPSEGM